MTRFHFQPSVRFSALSIFLTGVLCLLGRAEAQMSHSSPMVMTKPASACEGIGLDCANAATPYFSADGEFRKLLLINRATSFWLTPFLKTQIGMRRLILLDQAMAEKTSLARCP